MSRLMGRAVMFWEVIVGVDRKTWSVRRGGLGIRSLGSDAGLSVGCIAQLTLAVGLVVLFAIGCEGPTSTGSGSEAIRTFRGTYPIRIVCTTGMVADLARNVGGVGSGDDEILEVVQLMRDGVDPHTYKASPRDVRELSQADLILYSGHHLEGKMGELFERMGRRVPTVAVTEAIDESLLLPLDGNLYDPHLWFDVGLWSETVSVVRDALIDYDPDHTALYRTNAEAYLYRLEALDAECRERLASVPKDRRILLTSHDAFGYFGRAYNFEVRGIQGISTESEAGLRRINELVEFLSESGQPAVFVETSVSEKNMQALLEGCAARGHEVIIGGTLFSDAMGPLGTPEGTYEGMVQSNVRTIVRGLTP